MIIFFAENVDFVFTRAMKKQNAFISTKSMIPVADFEAK
jgi:hypothetical protein